MHKFGCANDYIQDISEVALSACASLFEMYAGLHSKRCRVRDVDVIEYLVHNSGFHHLRLMKLVDVITNIKFAAEGQPALGPDKPWNSVIGGNKFHMLMQHLARAKLEFGANLSVIDTEESEGCHKTFVKKPYLVSVNTVLAKLSNISS